MVTNVQWIIEEEVPQNYAYLQAVFKGEKGKVYVLLVEKKEGYTFLVGLGKRQEITPETFRVCGGEIAKQAQALQVKTLGFCYCEIGHVTIEDQIGALVEGLELGQYRFENYKSDQKEVVPITYTIDGIPNEDKGAYIIKEAKNKAEGICFARDLINEPANKLYPEVLAQKVLDISEKYGLEVKVFDEHEIEELGMHAMLAVGNGSIHRPRLIVIKHLKGDDEPIYGIVGKGLTCDTGGYSLKSSDSMYYNKSDMSGAANAIGIMLALAKNNIKKNVIAVIPTCENVISDRSYKIGDVLTTKLGKTVEVLNTDAEGRLVLADALTYIVKEEKVDCIIDMATLTGVAGTTFGNIYTPIISNNDQLYANFMEAAKCTEELFWKLPTHEIYRSWINSDVADLKNTGGAGTITAAMFLQEFVEDKPWLHMDIAATACTNPPLYSYGYKGGTGIGIRTIYHLIKGFKCAE